MMTMTKTTGELMAVEEIQDLTRPVVLFVKKNDIV